MDISDFLLALADPTRRTLFEAILRSPTSVGRLAAGVTVSRPAVSQHLKTLLESGLVVYHREGTQNIYEANPESLKLFRDYIECLESIWSQALANLKEAAESSLPDAQRNHNE
jgi:DNA-binding transcriptional ArsR family regulator